MRRVPQCLNGSATPERLVGLKLCHQHAEPEELSTPVGLPAGRGEGGGLTLLRGLVLRMKNFFLVFNVFKIFVKIFVHNEIYR